MAWGIFKEKLRYEKPDDRWYLDRYYKDPKSGFTKQVSFQVNSRGMMWIDKILINDQNGRFRRRAFPIKNVKVPFSYEMKSKPRSVRGLKLKDVM